ncbi:MAG: PQQ-binding-like beta-propeller repeat protein [Armatimonadetes bacterium]|nr:PQQ-binding-like beta-propeller repeat protein [Armatimonadota bacterium]
MQAVRTTGVILLALLCLTAGIGQAAMDYAAGPGTIGYALTQPDGARASLTMVIIGRVDTAGVSVHEWWDKTTSLPALFSPPPGLLPGQTIDLEGVMTTLPRGGRAVLCDRIAYYLDRYGYLAPAVPPLKGLFDASVWPTRGWLEVRPSVFLFSLSSPEMNLLLDDPQPPGEGDPPPLAQMTLPDHSIAKAKSAGDDDPIPESLTGKIVTAGTNQFSGCFYVEEPDRSCGIRVVPTSGTYVPGDVVTISAGTMATSDDGERFIDEATVSVTGSGEVLPLGLPNRDIGGCDFADGQTILQAGVLNGRGLNNIGLLVKTWGVVTEVCPAEHCFYLDDGSALDDTTHTDAQSNPVLGIRVSWDWSTGGVVGSELALVEKGWRLQVIGISSMASVEEPEEALIRVLRPRTGIGGDVAFDDVEFCDWPMFMHDPHHTGRSPVPDLGGVGANETITMYRAWTAEVPTLDGQRARYPNPPFVPQPDNHRNALQNQVDHPIFDSSPVVKMWRENGETVRRVYVGGFNGTYTSSSGRLYCFDFEGASVWTYPDTGQSALSGGVASTPAVAWVDTATGPDLRVFFGCAKGKLYAVSASSGALRWQYDTESMILAAPVVWEGVVYIGNEMNELVAVDAATGDEVFTTTLNQYAQDGITGTSSPMLAEAGGADYVFVTSDDGYAYKVYAAGHALEGQIAARYPNETPTQQDPYGLDCLESSPSYMDGIVYFGSTLCAPESGQYNMYGLDASTFGLQWNGFTNAEVRTTPALCPDGIYVGDETGIDLYHFGFDTNEVEAIQIWDTDGHAFASPALTSGVVLHGNDKGLLQARRLVGFTEPPGNKLLLPDAVDVTGAIGGPISSSPAVCYTLDEGIWRRWLFVTTRNGHIYDQEWMPVAVPSMLQAFCSEL